MITMESLMKLRLFTEGIYEKLPSPEEVLEWFKVLGAGWIHNGDPKQPHVILHSKKHSNGFFLCKKVLAYGNLREILAACIIREVRMAQGGSPPIHGVFGAPYSSILLAGDVGRLLGVKNYVPEKDPADPNGKLMRFKPDDVIPEGSYLLQIEELVTTWDSGGSATNAIIAGNPYPVKFLASVGVLVHRPSAMNRLLPDGRTIVPFIERQVDAWEPADCPLCKAGSEAVLPKGENWAKLTA